jgi:hypothetical protein
MSMVTLTEEELSLLRDTESMNTVRDLSVCFIISN